jgi:hypothetical protein
LSVPSFWQPLVIGLIILFGVILDTYRRRFSEVRRAVQVLRSKAVGKSVQDEHVAKVPVARDAIGNRVIHNPISDPGHERKTDREKRDGSVVARQKNQDGKLGKEE